MLYVCAECKGDLRVTCTACGKVGITQQEYNAKMLEINPEWDNGTRFTAQPSVTITSGACYQ